MLPRNDATIPTRFPSQFSVREAQRKHLEQAIACPKCKTPAGELQWIFIRDANKGKGWQTRCARCELRLDFFQEYEDVFWWSAVNVCRQDNELQSRHSVADALHNYLQYAMACPRCKTGADQLTWIYFQSPWKRGKANGWLVICNQCSIQVDFFVEEQEMYSWDQVERCRLDRNLQQEHSLDRNRYPYAKPCPRCGTLAQALTWFYFSSPEQDWRALAGRAGWMIVCDVCHIQADLIVEMMS
jgi:phage FluMu protein Com